MIICVSLAGMPAGTTRRLRWMSKGSLVPTMLTSSCSICFAPSASSRRLWRRPIHLGTSEKVQSSRSSFSRLRKGGEDQLLIASAQQLRLLDLTESPLRLLSFSREQLRAAIHPGVVDFCCPLPQWRDRSVRLVSSPRPPIFSSELPGRLKPCKVRSDFTFPIPSGNPPLCCRNTRWDKRGRSTTPDSDGMLHSDTQGNSKVSRYCSLRI